MILIGMAIGAGCVALGAGLAFCCYILKWIKDGSW